MPYKVSKECKYLKEHDWAKIDDGTVLVGITDFAQKTLKDVVYVELPDKGETVTAGEVFGSIESVKAVSDLVSPVSGEVIEVNQEVIDTPELVNEDPYGTWLIRIKPSNLDEDFAKLLTPEAYEELCDKEG